MRRIAALGAVMFLGGCPPATTGDTVPVRRVSIVVTGFDDADLVAFDQSGAVFYAITDKGLKETGHAKIGRSGPVSGDWASRGELWIGGDDHTVMKVTSGGVTQLEAPSFSDFALKPPKNVDELEDLDWEDLVVDDSGAWWGVCHWGHSDYYDEDGGRCDKWVWRKLPSGERVEGGEKGRTWKWPEVAAPETCDAEAIGPDDYWGYAVLSTRWVSADPPGVIVVRGYQYEGSPPQPQSWELRRGCQGEIIARGNSVAPGPGDLWIGYGGEDYDDQGRQTVFQGGRKVGVIRRGRDVKFRPKS
jgi:hypothetical protein